MDINRILNKILLERDKDRTAKGINYNDSFMVLDGAMKACEGLSFLKGKTIKKMSPTSPIDGDIPLMNKFEEVYNMRPDSVAFAGGQLGNKFVVVFGVLDPKAPKQALLAYTVTEGQKADILPNGAASGCPQLQKIEDYGQAYLSEINKFVLQGVIDRCGGRLISVGDASKDPSFNMSNYKRKELKDLKDCVTGEVPQWDKGVAPDGYVWEKVAAGDIKYSSNADRVADLMSKQGFTSNQDEVPDELLELGFYLQNIKSDTALLRIDPKLTPKVPYWPKPGGGVIVDPTNEQCRDLVKLLNTCRTNEKGVTLKQCDDKLFQRKLSTIRCNKKGMFRAGGVLGLKDEFESLMGDYGKYGLGNLAAALGKVSIQGESTLEKRINKVLNEEHKKFSFNSKPQPKVEFDKELVENLATQLVLSAYFDLQESMKKMKTLNESTFSDITSALGFNLTDKLTQGAKEMVVGKIVEFLGFDPKSYTSLLVINIFANLEFKDYLNFINDCEKFTPIIVKSALEAWLDYAYASMVKDQGVSFVYSALKNAVTETAAQTTIFKKLEFAATKIVCPLVESIGEGIKSGNLNIF